MNSVAQAKACYQDHFARIGGERGETGQAWMARLREAAMSRFNELGFPTLRDEEWKYTNVAPIAESRFLPAPPGGGGLTPDSLVRKSLGSQSACQLVFVNGSYAAGLSSLSGLPQGVEVASLGARLRGETACVESHLARYAGYQEQPFVALNTALMKDGAFVHVPRGEIVEEPIHLVFVSMGGREATVCHPRNLIVLEREAQAAIVESYMALDDEVYFTNAVTEIVLGENGVAHHYKLQRESLRAYHIATVQADLARAANFSSHSISLGGALVRNDINAVLDGEGCECVLNGLYLAGGEQHVDNHTRIDHVKPHGTSRELYKGILDGRARGVFNGKIYVHKAAQRTDAKQTNNNLLLSEGALVDTKPQLEIYNNDVKCTHGSTIGQLNEEAVFYLRSRGVSAETARSLLTVAFAGEVVSRIKIDSLRQQMSELLEAKFHRQS